MGEEIDWGKVTQYEQAVNEYTAAQLAKVKIFDPKEITKKAKQIREIVDEDLGTIRYVLLTYNDLTEIIDKYTDNKDRSVQLLFKQLAPANPDLTIDDIRGMPYEVVVRLLTKLQQSGFFPQRTSPSGSTSTQKPKPSDSSPTSTATSFTG
jgi:hypothetical protein